MKSDHMTSMMKEKSFARNVAWKVGLGWIFALAPLCAQEVTGPSGNAEPKVVEEVPAATVQVIPRPEVEKSLLRVAVTSQSYHPRLPWQKLNPTRRSAVAPLLAGNRILTTAQMVADATYIEVEIPQTGQKLTAAVEWVDYEANLALLKPARDHEDAFFAGLKPLELDSTEAKTGESLEIVLVEKNGSAVVTPILLNRFDVQPYWLEGSMFLVYETSGAIRSEGSSFTAPILKNGKLAGLLLRYNARDQAATILPAPIISRFLEDQKDGEYKGFASLGVYMNDTLDPQFRKFLSMTEDQGGLYLSDVAPGGTAAKAGLKTGDVLLKIQDYEIDRRGNYQDPVYGTLGLAQLIRQAGSAGDRIKMTYLREGKVHEVEAELVNRNPRAQKIPPYRFDSPMPYLIHGGLLFMELEMNYLRSFGENWPTQANLKLVMAAQNHDQFAKDREKVVFLSFILPCAGTQGYEEYNSLILDQANGVSIGSLKDLEKALESPQNGIHTFQFQDFPNQIFLDAVQAERDNQTTMRQIYRVQSLKGGY